VGGGGVADVAEVEREQRAEVASFELRPESGEPFRAEPVEVDALLSVDGHRAAGGDAHGDVLTSVRVVQRL